MKILLLHPEDAFDGPWSRERWNTIIDLGRAPRSFYDDWSTKFSCPAFSIFDLAIEIEDLRVWRSLIELGRGQVVDGFGIDWWDVVSIALQRELQDFRLIGRLAEEIGTCESLAVSRPSPLAEALSVQLRRPLRTMQTNLPHRVARNVGRYKRAAANLTFEQFRQVVYDKYDARYAWRRKFAIAEAASSEPAVLLPSAYSNVTRTAFRYAAVLPEQRFFLVLGRESGAVSPVPSNVQTAVLASFASKRFDQVELRQLESKWDALEDSLRNRPDFQLSVKFNVLRKGKRWLRWGVVVRDAWNAVFERRNIVGCLSADDANLYTRIPLLLARRRDLPAVACHHGALDAGMAFKSPASSLLLVKGEMEYDYLQRICEVDTRHLRIGEPSAPPPNQSLWRDGSPYIVFFTEPYESDFWRAEAVHRDVLPRLCAAARRAGKTVLVKLHPFESLRHRQRMVKRVLSEPDHRLVTITAAPLSLEILEKTWCAVSVESTTAFECATVGIPAFLCGWLRHAYLGYAPQYARFGVAKMLPGPDSLLRIPDLVRMAIPPPGLVNRLVRAIPSSELKEILCDPEANALR
jgi:hypothetical protein